MQHYRGFQQPMPPQVPQRSPHGPNQRARGGPGPIMAGGQPVHPQVAMAGPQVHPMQLAQQQAAEAAKRRSVKPTDKNLPDGIEDCIIDGDIARRYKELRDVERRLDTIMTRKRLDVNDTASYNNKLTKTLRIWITNTVEDQVWQGSGGLNVDAFDFSPNTEASYRVKIQGRILESGDSDAEATAGVEGDTDMSTGEGKPQDSGNTAAVDASRQRFSHFFKEINVDFEKQRFRNGTEQTVNWKRPEPNARSQASSSFSDAADFDEFTFKRNGDENINVKINLHRFEVPERYTLSSELAEIIDMTEATHLEAVMGLWEYIRMNGLQEDEEKRNFRCNDLLKTVIGQVEVGHIPALNEYVKHHLRPLEPISLPYTIRVDEQFHENPQATVYDVKVLVDDPLRTTLQSMVNNPQYVEMIRDVNDLDEQLARLVQAISISSAKKSFFGSLSSDPTNFIRNWLSSQKRDLDVIFGESSRSIDNGQGDEWQRRGGDGVWASQNARESVNVLLSKQR